MHPVHPTNTASRSRRRLVAVCAAGAALVASAAVASASGSTPGSATSALPAGVSPMPLAAGDPESVDAFVPVTPVRVLDTRGAPNGPIGVSTAAPMGPGQQIDLTLAGAGRAIPAGATSAVLNIAIDQDASLQSFLTIWPKGEPKPFTAANNATPGLVAANFTMAKLGSTGGISLFNQQGNVNVVIDLVGYTVPVSSVGTGSAISAYNALGAATPVAAGAAVAFSEAGPVVGTDIVRTDADTFTVGRAGVYEVSYRLSTAGTSPLGGAQLKVGGTATAPANTLGSAGTELSDTVLVTAAAGATIELTALAPGLTLATGASATIDISWVGPTPTTTTTTTPGSTTTTPASSTSTSSPATSTTGP